MLLIVSAGTEASILIVSAVIRRHSAVLANTCVVHLLQDEAAGCLVRFRKQSADLIRDSDQQVLLFAPGWKQTSSICRHLPLHAAHDKLLREPP